MALTSEGRLLPVLGQAVMEQALAVRSGLRLAIQALRPDEKLLVNFGQGFQHRHVLWRDTLSAAGLTQSMSRKGTCLVNAAMKGFFSHLKEEWLRIQKPETIEEIHAGLTDHLKWWNTTFIQKHLGDLSLDEHRARTTAIA